MKGSITLNVENARQISGEVNLVGVGAMEKVVLLHAFCSALDIDNDALLTMMLTRSIFDEGAEKTVIDLSAFRKGSGESGEDA